jgi:hypothetical protein
MSTSTSTSTLWIHSERVADVLWCHMISYLSVYDHVRSVPAVCKRLGALGALRESWPPVLSFGPAFNNIQQLYRFATVGKFSSANLLLADAHALTHVATMKPSATTKPSVQCINAGWLIVGNCAAQVFCNTAACVYFRSIISPNTFSCIRKLHICHCGNLADSGMLAICELQLVDLALGVVTHVTSVGYAQLSKITAVEGLHLNNTSITNQDLLHLTQLTQLTRLCLHGNENILDDDLAMLTLGSLPLQSLSLLNMNITDDGLSCVAQMTSLTALDLYGIGGFTEVGLQGVLLLPQLGSFVPPSDANWVTWASEWLIAQVKPHLLVCPARPVCCHTAWSIEFDTVRTDCMYEGYSTARTSCVSTSSPE